LLLVLPWLVLSLTSAGHILGLHPFIVSSASFRGGLFLLAVVSTLGYGIRKTPWSGAAVFLAAFVLAFLTGAFLEPPEDTLQHLHRSRIIGESGNWFNKPLNSGFFSHAVNGSILELLRHPDMEPEDYVGHVNVVHGLVSAILLTSIYAMCLAAGASRLGGIFGALLAVCFYGIAPASYFPKFSLAPAALTMAMYWLWITMFFFATSLKTTLTGLGTAIVALPIMASNHLQETFFLLAFLGPWLLLNLSGCLKQLVVDDAVLRRRLLVALWSVSCLILLAPVLPDVREAFGPAIAQKWNYHHSLGALRCSGNSVCIPWLLYQRFPEVINPLHVLIPVAALFLGVRQKGLSLLQTKTVLLGFAPFLLFLPAIQFAWYAMANWDVIYRFGLASTPWVFFAMLPPMISRWGQKRFPSPNRLSLVHGLALGSVFLLVIAGGLVRSEPINGKLDHVFMDKTPWLHPWRPLIETALDSGDFILSDPMTLAVLYSVFDVPLRQPRDDFNSYIAKQYNHPMEMGRYIHLAVNRHQLLLVNLRGFEPTWFGEDAGLWPSEWADTANFYHVDGVSSDCLADHLLGHPEMFGQARYRILLPRNPIPCTNPESP
jgi:hypothetical protein